MKKQIQSMLLPFHFGSIDDKSRLVIEKEMLQDPEVLVEYFDLKRNLESAEEIPMQPSSLVWNRLKVKIQSKQKKIFTWSFGLAVAASLTFLCFQFLKPLTVETRITETGILFDSGSELPVNSNVL